MPIKAKRQPFHRPSMQSPHIIATILFFDVTSGIAHSYIRRGSVQHSICSILTQLHEVMMQQPLIAEVLITLEAI